MRGLIIGMCIRIYIYIELQGHVGCIGMPSDMYGYVVICSPLLRRLPLNWGLLSLINLHGVTRTRLGVLYRRGSIGAHDVGIRRYM